MPKNVNKKNSRSMADKKTEKKRTSPVKILAIILCSLLLLAVVVIAAGAFYFYHFDFGGTILQNVYVAGVNVGGMTVSQATDAVKAATANTYTSQNMTVKVLDQEITIAPADSGAKLNVSFAIWDAYSYGRRGFESQQMMDLADSADGITLDITKYLHLDKRAIRSSLDEFSRYYSTNLTQSTYEVTGSNETLTLVVHLGIPEYGLDLDDLFEKVMDSYCANLFFTEGECGILEPDPIDLEAIHKEHYVAPVDASYSEKFDVIEGKDGFGFDVSSAKEKLADAAYGSTVEIPFSPIAPEITGKMLSERLFCDTLGNHTATQSSSSNRQTNLRLACEAIDGVILYPGDVFSYNETLGERTAEKGYKYGASYSGGETISTIGGGICQVSSTLYYCCLQADMEILKRENHSYAPGYVPLGMDATVSWGYLDFSFRNNHDYPIRIDAKADGGSTTVSLVGTDTKDYYVKMEYVVTAYYKYETKYETMKPDNPKGYKDGDTITSPCSGYDVVTYRVKYKKGTDEQISKDYEATSKFAKRDAVICKIDNGTTTTPPTESAPPDTTQPGIGNGNVTEDGGALPE